MDIAIRLYSVHGLGFFRHAYISLIYFLSYVFIILNKIAGTTFYRDWRLKFKYVSLTVGACESDDAYPAQGQSPETVGHVHSPDNYETSADRVLAIYVRRQINKGEKEDAEEERMGKKRTECFRIIREGLSFSRTRLGPRSVRS